MKAKDRRANKKVVFTGGHHNSGLVVAQAMQKKGWEVFWFGHRRSMDLDQSDSAEYKEVTQASIPFYELKTAKIHHIYHPWRLLKVIKGLGQSFFLLRKVRPNLVFSWGGYLAAPVSLAAWVLRIPVVTHEQTVCLGMANRFVARLAEKVFITWPQTAPSLPVKKVVVSGLPLRDELNQEAPVCSFAEDKPVVYISGGKQGSHRINMAVGEVLGELLTGYNLIHQTGSHSLHRDFEKLELQVRKLGPHQQASYKLKRYFYKNEVGGVFGQSSVAVGRAGAHFTYELAWLGLPAVLIPLPGSTGGEQEKQAEILAKTGLTRTLPQSELTGQRLLREIQLLFEEKDTFQSSAQKARQLVKPSAVLIILEEVNKICN
ncbi:UDP-N-acetylglucosamine--N-acetylmuramyl-(pentapeptide) pyrophosphoryl-undecaprenol N-acetylglucosamine transferase [Patescibacteria group bacterium]|nr:UDP-N-acetylglucosamine--N-acetylmuramyl-(pentapeptide) pyrophosphoryl-undecaprenol N-acetylglucosamine transferase [Patescibacteria group bacterium]